MTRNRPNKSTIATVDMLSDKQEVKEEKKDKESEKITEVPRKTPTEITVDTLEKEYNHCGRVILTGHADTTYIEQELELEKRGYVSIYRSDRMSAGSHWLINVMDKKKR